MPLYDFRCGACDEVREEFRSYESRDRPAACRCGGEMGRAFLPPQVMRDIAEYTSPIDGTRITSRSQHRDHMRRHGVIEMGNEMPKPRPRIATERGAVRAEMAMQVERMKSEGKIRER